MGLLSYVSLVAIVAAFAFVILSLGELILLGHWDNLTDQYHALASGLLYISELIEEHSRLAKVVGQRGIYAVIILHGLLYVFDTLPFPQLAFSIICHLVYLQNFSNTWPLISLTSPSFLASCVFVIADHFFWFFYFSRQTQEARATRIYRGTSGTAVHGFSEIAAFFGICVWLAPLFLFLSLSANDNALPTSSSTAEPGSQGPSQGSQRSRISLFRSIFSVLPLNRVTTLKSKHSRRDSTDGLIVPPSPGASRTPMMPLHPPPSPSLVSKRSSLPPPRSPGGRSGTPDFDAHLSPASTFTLNSPPRRGNGLGLGIRRPIHSTGDDDDLFSKSR